MDSALAEAVRASGASAALLYALPQGAEALWLAAMTGTPAGIAAPWLRVGLFDPVPVADAVREQHLVWVAGQEEMARRYPQTALVLPYDYAVAAAPVTSGATVWGGLVLLWPGAHPPGMSPQERAAVDAGCQGLGAALRRVAERGGRVLPEEAPRMVPPPPPDDLSPEDAQAKSAFVDRLPGGSCALDLEGRFVFVSPGTAEVMGVDSTELVGSLLWEAVPWVNIPEAEDSYREALVSRRPTSFTALRPPETWLSFSLFPDSRGVSLRIVPVEVGNQVPVSRAGAGTGAAAGPSSANVFSHVMHLATRLTEAIGVEDVVEQTADHLLPALGAQAMVLVTADDGRQRVLGHRGYHSDIVSFIDGITLSSDTPTCRVTSTGEPLFFTGTDDFRRAYPFVIHQQDKAARAVLPLIASRVPVGALLLGYDRPRPFPPGERAILTSLAGLVGQALDRARLYDANYDLAHHLQSALLPHSLPHVPRIRVTSRYLPAARGLGIGGDFYDLIRLDRYRAAAAIGDVQGHNVDAAVLMGQVRTAVHAQANAGAPPNDVLSAANRLLADLDPGLFTSCLYVDLDVAGNLARVSTAGHPPPLLRHADGRTEVLPVSPGLLLGIEREADYPMTEVALPPGGVLVLYTDGLVEVPGVDPDETLASLAGVVAKTDPGHGLDAMADVLIHHAPAPRDDIALLLIHLDADRSRTT